MKKLFTLVCAMLASFSLWASAVGDLKTISVNHTVYFEEIVSAGVSSGTLIDNGFLFSPKGNTYATNKGKDAAGHLYCLRVKSATQDLLAFKVSRAGTLVIYGDRVTDRTPFLNTTAADDANKITGTATAGGDGQKWGTVEFAIPAAGTYYIIGTGDHYLSCLAFTFPADHTKASLSRVTIDGVYFEEYDPATLEYTVDLEYGTVDVPVVAAVAGDDATIVVTQAEALPGAATIACTSQDESETKTYTINFTLPAAPSDDATLKDLTIGGKTVSGFDAATYEYDVELEYDVEAIPTVAAEKNEDHATVEVTQAAAIPGAATVVVTAQDGETTLTYTINFTKESETPIIRATHVNKNTATVKGSIGGTAAKSTQDNGKLGSNGHYFGIILADDKTFQTGDSLVVNLSAAATGENIFLGLYAEKEGTTLLYNTGIELGVAGNNSVILPEALNGKTSFYIVRPGDANKWNGAIQSISVYRKPSGPATALDNTADVVKATKRIVNGQLIIEKNGEVYNVLGARVR